MALPPKTLPTQPDRPAAPQREVRHLLRADGPTGPATGLWLVACGAALALAVGTVVPISPLVLAVLVGIIIGNTGLANARTEAGLTFAAKRLLRVGVVLLGLRLAVGDIATLGRAGLLVVLVTVAVTFFGTQAIGRRLGLSPDLSLLVATGYSICGASAIAAVEDATDADEEEVAVAIGLVTLFGSLAIVTLPLLAGPLGLSDDQFGAWAGASVHDVAQVAATASAGGASVVAVAMVVKLTRVLLLTPVVLGVNLRRAALARRSDSGHTANDTDTGSDAADLAVTRPPILPLFVAGFLAMVALRTSGILPTEVVSGARWIEGVLFAAALVGLGSGVRLNRLRRLGPTPLLLGFIAWVLVAAISYGGVLAVL
ncbi:MAG: putative sulfate exporter family transporter [Actinomycetota bacterium]